jgi:hypothetical protein
MQNQYKDKCGTFLNSFKITDFNNTVFLNYASLRTKLEKVVNIMIY